jgi:plasmid segregation protein ParM
MTTNTLIAIDIGYGDIKVYLKDNTGLEKYFKFTNAISFAGNSSVPSSVNALEVFRFNDQDYIVGEDALWNTPFTARRYQYLYDYAPLLVYKALKMANVDTGTNIKLITGLSLKDWARAEEFGERLTNIFVNNEHYHISADNIYIVPQGKGVYIDYKFTNNVTNDCFAIVDIGYNTFDFLIFSNGSPIPNKNYANTLGVNNLVQELQKYLANELQITNFSEQEVKNILFERSVRIGAKTHDLSVAIKKEVIKYSKLIQNEILDKNEDIISKVNNIILSGGGAYLLKEENVQIFDNQVYSETPYEFANVRGYYKELEGCINE